MPDLCHIFLFYIHCLFFCSCYIFFSAYKFLSCILSAMSFIFISICFQSQLLPFPLIWRPSVKFNLVFFCSLDFPLILLALKLIFRSFTLLIKNQLAKINKCLISIEFSQDIDWFDVFAHCFS